MNNEERDAMLFEHKRKLSLIDEIFKLLCDQAGPEVAKRRQEIIENAKEPKRE